MNDLTTFNSPEFGEIRTVTINDETWFIGKEIAEILGYRDPGTAILDHVDKDDLKTLNYKAFGVLYPSLWNRTNDFSNKNLINESGLYSLVFNSQLESAQRFKRWVTHEILPSIHKHGAYMTPETIQKALSNPDFIIGLATQLKEEQQKNRQLTAENIEMKPKAEFYDAVANSDTAIDMLSVAKLLNCGYGRNTLFKILKEEKIFMKSNKPYQEYMDRGYFKVIEQHYKIGDEEFVGFKTLVYQKGLDFIRKVLNERNEGLRE